LEWIKIVELFNVVSSMSSSKVTVILDETATFNSFCPGVVLTILAAIEGVPARRIINRANKYRGLTEIDAQFKFIMPSPMNC